MKKFLCLMLIMPIHAGRVSKEMVVTYRVTEQSSPTDKHKRSRSYPGIENIFLDPVPLQIMPPVPQNTPKDLSLDEISITIPKEEAKQTMEEQIQAITNEDKKSNGNPCTPTRLVVVGSICTALAGVMTAVVTATVTLIVHFTTK